MWITQACKHAVSAHVMLGVKDKYDTQIFIYYLQIYWLLRSSWFEYNCSERGEYSARSQHLQNMRLLCLILKSVTPTKCQLTVGFKIFNDVSSYQEVSLVTIINYPNSNKFWILQKCNKFTVSKGWKLKIAVI